MLLATDNPSVARAIEQALRDAGIRFETGLRTKPDPGLVFTVRECDAATARAVIEQAFGSGPLTADDAPQDEGERGGGIFPRGPIAAAAALALLHLALVVLLVGRDPAPGRFAALGALVVGAPPRELWRLVTSLFLHSDPGHVFWNGLSMTVFAVPLIDRVGWTRTALLYLAGGVLGGVAALLASDPGTVILGSSGAVAGLFGGWLVSTIRRARRAPLARRAVVRAVGIGLLVLPSLLTPTTAGGKRISVAAHLGGLGTGLLWGAAASRRGRGAFSAGGRPTPAAPFPGPRSRS